MQRDLLPIVEGSTVNTKYGAVKTDHILFVASGAFHTSKPSDLIPEFQGRFPIRVELKALTREDFMRILTEPENALTRQYVALMETEGVHMRFSEDGVAALAEIAAKVNARSENIGARRLHTVLERLLEELSFNAPELPDRELTDRRRIRSRPPRRNRQGRGSLALYSVAPESRRRGECTKWPPISSNTSGPKTLNFGGRLNLKSSGHQSPLRRIGS